MAGAVKARRAERLAAEAAEEKEQEKKEAEKEAVTAATAAAASGGPVTAGEGSENAGKGKVGGETKEEENGEEKKAAANGDVSKDKGEKGSETTEKGT